MHREIAAQSVDGKYNFRQFKSGNGCGGSSFLIILGEPFTTVYNYS